MTKKTQAKKATNKKPATKAAPKAAPAKKTTGSGEKAGSTPKIPAFLKNSPTEYIVGTEDYAALVQDHNEKFGTHGNRWRVQPQVFYTIHEKVWKHYHDKK